MLPAEGAATTGNRLPSGRAPGLNSMVGQPPRRRQSVPNRPSFLHNPLSFAHRHYEPTSPVCCRRSGTLSLPIADPPALVATLPANSDLVDFRGNLASRAKVGDWFVHGNIGRSRGDPSFDIGAGNQKVKCDNKSAHFCVVGLRRVSHSFRYIAVPALPSRNCGVPVAESGLVVDCGRHNGRWCRQTSGAPANECRGGRALHRRHHADP